MTKKRAKNCLYMSVIILEFSYNAWFGHFNEMLNSFFIIETKMKIWWLRIAISTEFYYIVRRKIEFVLLFENFLCVFALKSNERQKLNIKDVKTLCFES